MPITLSRQQHPRCRRRRGKLRRYISEALIPVSGFRFRRQYDLAPPRIGPKIRPRHPHIRPQNPAPAPPNPAPKSGPTLPFIIKG